MQIYQLSNETIDYLSDKLSEMYRKHGCTPEENPMAFMIESVMASFEGDLPTWNFRNRENEILFTLLFAQLGLPSEAVGLMIAVNAPLQFLTVAVDTWVLTGECIYLSKSGKQAAEES